MTEIADAKVHLCTAIIRRSHTQDRPKCDEADVLITVERERGCRIAGILSRGDTDAAMAEGEGQRVLALKCTWLAAHLHEPDTAGVSAQ